MASCCSVFRVRDFCVGGAARLQPRCAVRAAGAVRFAAFAFCEILRQAARQARLCGQGALGRGVIRLPVYCRLRVCVSGGAVSDVAAHAFRRKPGFCHIGSRAGGFGGLCRGYREPPRAKRWYRTGGCKQLNPEKTKTASALFRRESRFSMCLCQFAMLISNVASKLRFQGLRRLETVILPWPERQFTPASMLPELRRASIVCGPKSPAAERFSMPFAR